jgi:WD40 repeat protein
MLAVNAVAVSPNGKFVATAGTDQTIKIWDIVTGKEVGTLIGNADTPFALAFLGNDAVVMGGSLPTRDTGRLHFWGTTPPRLNKSVPTGEVYTIVPSTDGSRIAVWATRPAVGDTVKNNTYELYSAAGDLVSSYTDKGRNVRSATFTPDLAWAVAGDETGGVQVFDLAKKERVGGNMPLFSRSVVDIGITPDKKFIVATDDAGEVKVAELKDGKLSVVGKGKAHKSGARAVLVGPTGKTFFTISNDRELKLWSLTDLKEESLVELRSWVVPVSVNGAAYTPDGKSIVTANADGTAYVLELP